MNDPEIDAREALALELATRAGRRIAEDWERGVEVQTKSSAIDLVTEVDRAAEAIIVEGIANAFPGDGVLAEESGESVAKAPGTPRWIVDPLDGTTNFVHGFPHFSVSIAVECDAELEVGVVHDPLRGESFVARRGRGAWLHAPGRPARQLSVTTARELGHCLVATGFGYARATDPANDRANDRATDRATDSASGPRTNLEEFARVMRHVRGIRRAGSAALDLAYVAAGRLDGYWEYGLSPWDWAAGLLLVQEAGGEASTVDGRPFRLGAPSLCVANPVLRPTLCATLVRG